MKRDKIIIFSVAFIAPALICLLLELWFKHTLYNLSSFNGIDVTKTLLGIWATLLGFIITAVSILITMGGKEYIHAFKESKHYKTVLLTYCFTSFALLVATIFGIVVICINTWNWVLFYSLIYLTMSTLLLLFFCILFLFFMIFKSI